MAYAAVRIYLPSKSRVAGFVISLRDTKDRAGDDILIYLRANAAMGSSLVCGLFDVPRQFKKGDTIYVDDISSGRVVPIQYVESTEINIDDFLRVGG